MDEDEVPADPAWMASLPEATLELCRREVTATAIAAIAEGDLSPLRRLLASWRTTADVLSDPESREMLLSDRPLDLDDFSAVERPR